MKSVYIREYKHYSQSEILEILGNNDEIFNRLQEYEIVAIDKDQYIFKFVGVIILEN